MGFFFDFREINKNEMHKISNKKRIINRKKNKNKIKIARSKMKNSRNDFIFIKCDKP